VGQHIEKKEHEKKEYMGEITEEGENKKRKRWKRRSRA
jgi:hypothetical protein